MGERASCKHLRRLQLSEKTPFTSTFPSRHLVYKTLGNTHTSTASGLRIAPHLKESYCRPNHLIDDPSSSFTSARSHAARQRRRCRRRPGMLLACFQSLHVRRATICPFLQRLKECERCLAALPSSRLSVDKIGAEEGDCFPHMTASKIQLPYSPNEPQNGQSGGAAAPILQQ